MCSWICSTTRNYVVSYNITSAVGLLPSFDSLHPRNKHVNPNVHSPHRYLLYLDFNSLYSSTCMTGNLPYGNICKLTQQEQDHFLQKGLLNHSSEADTGYWIDCDIKKVKEDVAWATDELPLVLSHLNITHGMLSPYSKEMLHRERGKLPRGHSPPRERLSHILETPAVAHETRFGGGQSSHRLCLQSV